MNFMRHSRFGKTVRWTIIGVAVGELAGLAGCYYLYGKMKSSRELRKKVYDFDQRILDAYYEMNAKVGNPELKQQDAIAWGLTETKDMTLIK